MSDKPNTPTRKGKFLAFLSKETAPIYLQFDSEGSTDGKSYWHRHGSREAFHPVGFIESPYHRSPEHEPKARLEADLPPKEDPKADAPKPEAKKDEAAK